MGSIKSHAVRLPYPAQGHINPMMQLAKLLHSRGFYITFVNSEFNHRRLIWSRGEEAVKGLPNFQFPAIPDGLPPSDSDATQSILEIFIATRNNCLAPFLELLSKLNSSPQLPLVTCIVCDGIMNCDKRFPNDGTLKMPIDWIPGMPNMRLKDIPSYIRTTDPNDFVFNSIIEVSQEYLNLSSIIFNRFDELDKEVLQVLASKSPNIYAIGPLASLSNNLLEIQYDLLNSKLWKEDISCIEWLYIMEPESVVYVNYGSVAVMSNHHLKEFAWGLANSKYPFLWVVRPDLVIGESVIFPREFLEEIKGKGFIISWSVGVFLTHYEWNSNLKALPEGVPLICLPFFDDQQMNCRYMCTTWGNGMEINPNIKHENVEALVKEMMEGDNGQRIRQKALEWKKKDEAAISLRGSTVTNFDRMINEALSHGRVVKS
ncbi:hypothetical protein ES332_A02G173000v1 [Gossypium tomentosum]|uniref:Glycosyltransferase N-terminal domain-containing protein n=1 Tax=Gossypium tomentosum TaxID=34277 RepID=A0A5D2RL81_GOSTO|nr:hypothetical protein ES332_A02G173000v1 [Gossypium tomentosum]